MLPRVDGYQIEQDLEPPHPRCTTSDPVYAALRGRERVALKLLSLGFPLRDESRARFIAAMHEARAIASPHVIPVIDAGFAEDGAPFYAMPLVAGVTLAATIERGILANADETRAILGQLADAAAAATAAGCEPMLHARHVLLDAGRARVWDLGVWPWRRWAHELVAGTYTNGGRVTWHPSITPREAKGLPASASNAAAQLALLAYSMLTGRTYWAADNDPEAAPMQLLIEAMAGAGAPPSTRTTIALPAGFDAWFTHCLADGFADAAAAARAFPS